MASKSILNDRDIEQILALKNEGLTFEAIADQFFVCQHTILYALRKRGIKIPKGRTGLKQQEIERILALKSQGLSGNLISKRLGIGRYIVNGVIRGSYKPNRIQTDYDILSNPGD